MATNGTQSLILQIVRDNSPISRSGIVAKTGQPHAAISRSTSVLLSNNILIEDEHADTTGPRRKRGLSLNPDHAYVVAVEYGPDAIEAVAMNTAYQPIARAGREVDIALADDKTIVAMILEIVASVQKDVSLPKKSCLGLAAVDPGIIDESAGTSVLSTTMENWRNVPVVLLLQEKLGIPVMLLGTSVAKIRAIDRLELAGKVQNLLYIEYGKGIACGMKLNGHYISGNGHLAGELGHLRITDIQTACKCGGVGCLEAIASLNAIAGEALQTIRGTNSMLSKQQTITGMDVLHCAAAHDKFASRLVEKAFEYLGTAVAGLVNVLSPHVIVFDNVVNEAGPEAFSVLLRTIRKTVLVTHQKQLDIRISTLATHIGALGGAAAVLDACIEN